MNNKKLPTSAKVIIIGGGKSAILHSRAVNEYIDLNQKDLCVIHSSSKNSNYYSQLSVKQFFCLVGNEGYRLNKTIKNKLSEKVYKCILPAYPRIMGTYIPEDLKEKAYELEKISFTKKYHDSHFAISLQTSIQLGAEEIFLVGFDGYDGNISNKEFELASENNYLIKKFNQKHFDLISFTQTNYKIDISSIYKYI